MVAPTYDPLTPVDTGPDVIFTTGTAQALDTNPLSIAQRGLNAPKVQVPVTEYKLTGTSVTEPVPDGVTAFEVEGLGGGGGSGAGGGGANGTATTFTYNGVTYTANGGSGASGTGGAAGGSASGGDINIPGGRGDPLGNDSAPRGGSPAKYGCGGTEKNNGVGYGAGAGGEYVGTFGDVGASGAGGYFHKRIEVVPGATTYTYTVGVAGSATYDGAPGLLIIRY